MQWHPRFFFFVPVHGQHGGRFPFAVNEYGRPLKGYSHQLWLREGWYMGGWSVKFCFKGKDYTAGDVEDLGHRRLR